MRIFVIISMFYVSLVSSDTPGNCSYSEIEGIWIFSVGKPLTKQLAFDDSDNYDYSSGKHTVKLGYPNLATDEFGNEGTWTLIYNQGFEVVIHGRKYFGYSKYDSNGTSYCDETMPSWSHDVLGHNWIPFRGKKQSQIKAMPPKTSDESHYLLLDQAQHMWYETSQSFIDDINQNAKTWHAAIYPEHKYYTFGDMVRLAGGRKSHIPSKPSTARVTETQTKVTSSLPDKFDWRDVNGQNFVSPIRNQGQCGSCYSFASLAMLEARIRILTNNSLQPVFAPQDVVECSRYSQGCEGGFAFLIAGKYAEDFGVVEESCNPYQGKDTNCTTPSSCQRYYATAYKYVGGYYGGCNDKALQMALYQNGPVAIGFEVTSEFMQYKGGIFQQPNNLESTSRHKFNPFELTNHAVLLVGWGEENGVPYWTVKNSWGTSWGEDGFFRIIRGQDELAIESMGLESFPIL